MRDRSRGSMWQRLLGGKPAEPAPAQAAPTLAEALGVLARRAAEAEARAEASAARRLAVYAALLGALPASAPVLPFLLAGATAPASSTAAERVRAWLLDSDALWRVLDPVVALIGLGARRQPPPQESIFAKGVAPDAFLADLLLQLANPTAIHPGDRQTGAAAVAQIWRAWEAPTDYVRLAVGLAMRGEAALANGDRVVLPDDWQAAGQGRERRLPCRLLQPAFMQYALGEGRYDNTADIGFLPEGGWARGLTVRQWVRLLSGLGGARFAFVAVRELDARQGRFVCATPHLAAATYASLEAAVRQGLLVPVVLAGDRNTAHFALVARLEGPQALMLDAQRGHYFMSDEALRKQLTDVLLREGVAPAASRGRVQRGTRPLLASELEPLFAHQNPQGLDEEASRR